MSLIKRALTNVSEQRNAGSALPFGDSTPPTNGMLGNQSAGVIVDDKSVLGIAAAYACSVIIANAVATLPLKQYRGKSTSQRQEVEPGPLLVQPCEGYTLLEWLVQMTVSLTLRGNAFGQIVDRDDRGYPLQIMPLAPSQVTVRRDTDGDLVYRVAGKVVANDDMMHMRNLMLPGNPVGVNPIEACRTSFGLARAAEMYAAGFFANSAIPGGVITVEGDLDTDETLALARNWMQLHGGLGNAGLPAVLTGGAKWEQVTIAPEDAQWIQSRQMSRADMATLFGVPPHMIGDVDRTTSWGAGIEQQEMGFVRITLAGYLRRFEDMFTGYTPRGQYSRFDITERLRGDTLQRYQAYTLGRNGGWLNADDIRQKEDMAPLPDGKGQDYIQPLNVAPVGSPAASGVPDPMAPPKEQAPSPGGGQ